MRRTPAEEGYSYVRGSRLCIVLGLKLVLGLGLGSFALRPKPSVLTLGLILGLISSLGFGLWTSMWLTGALMHRIDTNHRPNPNSNPNPDPNHNP